jgi:prepilin-type processing-associated H-X9-DG protein
MTRFLRTGTDGDINVLYFDGHVEMAPYGSAKWNYAERWLTGASQVRPYDFWKEKGRPLCAAALMLAGIAFCAIKVIRAAKRYEEFDGEVERQREKLERIGVAVRAFKESKGRYPFGTGRDFLDIVSKNTPAADGDGAMPCKGGLRMDTAGLHGPISPPDDGVPADRPVAGAIVSAFGRGAVMLVLYRDGSIKKVKKGTLAWEEAGEWLDGLRVNRRRRLVTLILLLLLLVFMAILIIPALQPAMAG